MIETEEKLVIVEEVRGDSIVEDKEKGRIEVEIEVKHNGVVESESTNVVTEVVLAKMSNGAIPKVERMEEPVIIEERIIHKVERIEEPIILEERIITSTPIKREDSAVKERVTMVSPPRREKKKVERKVLNTEVVTITEAKIEVPDTPQAQRKFVKESSLTPSDDTNISVDLRISESKDDLTSDASDVSNCKVAYSPLKDSSPELDNGLLTRKPEIPAKPINLENSSSRYHSDDNLNGSIYRKPSMKFKDLNDGPAPQRRSVKEIIESINKSQKLLKMNQAEEPITTDHNANQAFKTLEEREKEIKRMLEELDKPINTNSHPNKDLDDLVDSLNNNVSDNDVFQKCVVKKTDIRHTREQSPTVSNLDWNPIPKPKRSKNFN